MLGGEVIDHATVRNRWCRKIGVGGEQWLVIRGWDLAAEETAFDHRFLIRAEIGRWCRDPLQRSAVLEMYREAYRVDAAVRNLANGVYWLEQRIAVAFQNGILVVLVRPLWKEVRGSSSDSAATATDLEDRGSRDRGDREDKNRSAVVSKKTWVEIKLVDQDGAVVPNERYRVTLPDGTVKEGRLDEDGWMRESGIDPGQCTIAFPDIHHEEWDPK